MSLSLASDRVRLAAFSDTSPPVQKRVARAVASHQADCVLFAGDAVDGSQGGLRRRRAFRRWEHEVRARLPHLIAVPGNHDFERDGALDLWHRHVNGSTGGRGPATVLRAGPVTVAALAVGSGHHLDPEAVSDACDAISASDSPYRILLVHEPLFPVASHIGSSLDARPQARDALTSALREAGVSLVVSGHEHAYSRRPLPPGDWAGQVTVGGGGANLERNAWADVPVFEPRHHVLLIDAEPDSALVRCVGLDGRLLDQFYLPTS